MKTLKLRPVVWALATLVASSSEAQSVLDLGNIGGATSASAISADGSTVVGAALLPGSTPLRRAYRWTYSGGLQNLNLPVVESYATGVSRDGSVIAGSYYDLTLNGGRAFRWTAAGGMENLGTLGGNLTIGEGISQDGTTVVGQSNLANNTNRAFRWTRSGGMQNLGVLGTGSRSRASGVSADGAVVVGTSDNGTSEHAFRWTAAGMVDLGTLGGRQSIGNAVSGDGTVVVGNSQVTSPGPVYAFRWTQATGMQNLGLLGGTTGQSNALGISGNGEVIVGSSNYDDTYGVPRAFRWSEATGMQSVADWLGSSGASAAGWDFISATSANEDGSVLVGNGRSPGSTRDRAWIARVSPYGTGVMDPVNYVESTMVARQALAQANQYLSRMVLWGGHHRPLASYGDLGGQSCFWATGDVGRRGGDRPISDTAGEVGVCGDFAGGAVRAGLGVGYGRQSQNLGDFGSTRTGGNHVVGEINYTTATGLLLSATGVHGKWSADVNRGYTGASGIDHSKGSTGVTSTALRLRADWNDAWRWAQAALSPYVALTATRTRTDAYTERGGGFPARFDATKQSGLETRLGVAARYSLAPATHLRGTLEAIQRLDGDAPRVTGQVLGLFRFDQPGLDESKSWVRLGLDVDHQIDRNKLLSFSLHTATPGDDPRLSAAVTLRIGF
ncbi:MAG TPA: autotransporter domain-containing protein [Burkholderiaceae bacterium]|nr:autotransporter domain-containing protein [Burkholderiaceae bacterium]